METVNKKETDTRNKGYLKNICTSDIKRQTNQRSTNKETEKKSEETKNSE